jgi:hypothetical protein
MIILCVHYTYMVQFGHDILCIDHARFQNNIPLVMLKILQERHPLTVSMATDAQDTWQYQDSGAYKDFVP